MANQLSLEILIKTIADSRGITTTEADIKSLAASMQQAAAAGKPLETSADSIATALTKTAKATTESGDAANEAQQDQAKLALHYLTGAKAGDTAAASTKALGGELRHLQQAGTGANQVMQGLSQGGLMGITQAARGAITVFKSLSISIGGAVFLGAVAAAGAALVALRKIAADNEADMKKMWDASIAASKTYQSAVAEVTASVNAGIESQSRRIDTLTTDYAELITAMDKAEARAKAITAARKELALAQASTPEEKSAVEASFSGAANESDVLNAKLREEAANKAFQGAKAEADSAAANTRERQAKFDAAKQTAANLMEKTGASPETLQAQARARALGKGVEEAKAFEQTAAAKLDPLAKAAEEQRERASLVKEIAPIRSQTLAVESAKPSSPSRPSAPAAAANAAPKFDAAGARTRAGEVGSRYDELAGKLKGTSDNGEANKIAAEMTKLNTERAVLYKGIGDSIAAERKAADTLKKQMKNSREGGGG